MSDAAVFRKTQANRDVRVFVLQLVGNQQLITGTRVAGRLGLEDIGGRRGFLFGGNRPHRSRVAADQKLRKPGKLVVGRVEQVHKPHDGVVHARTVVPSETPRGPDATLERVADVTRKFRAEHDIERVGVGACGPVDQPLSPTPEIRPTEPAQPTATVRRGAVVETVQAAGRITSASQTSLFFRASGRVRSVNAEAGQPVKKGDVIAELETGQVGVQLETARVNLQIAELRTSQAAATSGESGLRLAMTEVVTVR